MTSRSIAGKVAAAEQYDISIAYLRIQQGIADALDMGIIKRFEAGLLAGLDTPPTEGKRLSRQPVNPTIAAPSPSDEVDQRGSGAAQAPSIPRG